MRCCAPLLLLLAFITSCSKKDDVGRTNFAELIVGNQKFNFDQREAIVDTSTGAIRCYLRFEDGTSNSTLMFKTITGLGRIVNNYQLPGELFPGPSLEYLHLQTYLNGFAGSYEVQNNSLIVTIDNAANGRMHGSLSGAMTCTTCPSPVDQVVITKGEFELPYSYQ